MGLLTRIAIPVLQVPTAENTAVDLRNRLVKEQTSQQVDQPQPDGSANEAFLSSTGTDEQPQPIQLNEGA